MEILQSVLNELWENKILLIILGIVIVLFVFLMVRKSQMKKCAKKLDDLEVRYNTVKSVPLAFKLNKSEALVSVDENISSDVDNFKDNFETVQSRLNSISNLLNEADDALAAGKSKSAKVAIEEIESILKGLEETVSHLDSGLDVVLEHETEQRVRINELKEKLLQIKNYVSHHKIIMAHCEPVIEQRYKALDKLFTAFEEWMFVTEYEKSGQVLADIETQLNDLEKITNMLPKLLELAVGTLPTLVDTVEKRYALALSQGASIDHLEVMKNLEVIKDNIKEDYDYLVTGTIAEVEVHLNNSLKRLNQLNEQINHEIDANADVDEIKKLISESYYLSMNNIEAAHEAYEQVSKRFDFTAAIKAIDQCHAELTEVYESYVKLNQYAMETKMSPANHCAELKQLLQKLVLIDDEINNNKGKIDLVRQYEDRAEQQIIKLQLIINEMLVKIKVNQLPSISSDFEGDVNKAQQYIYAIRGLLNSSELDVNLLNTTLDEAIDYTYKLYNNVNNIVGMAVMVENTIVFGNRYRSTFPEMDSELTRAELSYRNGEYTHALKTAISAIEKVHPGSYENLVKEKRLDG